MDPIVELIHFALTELNISADRALIFLVKFLFFSSLVGPLLNKLVPWARERAALTATKVDDHLVANALSPLAEFFAWVNAFLPRLVTGLANKKARPRVSTPNVSTLMFMFVSLVIAMGLVLQSCGGSQPRTPADHVQIQFVAVAVALDAADIGMERVASRRVNVCLEEMRAQGATDTTGYDQCVRDVTTAALALASVRAALVMADRTLGKIQAGTFELDPCGLVDNVLVELNNAIASLRALGPEMVQHVTSLTTLLPPFALKWFYRRLPDAP